jgi:hypothetical protein
MTWSKFFSLCWTSALNDDTEVERGFRMLFEGAQIGDEVNLDGVMQNMDGEMIIIRMPFRPRHVQGMLRVKLDSGSYSDNGLTEGCLAELEEAHRAPDLQAKMWNDTDYWPAKWLGHWTPQLIEQFGNFWRVPMELKQIRSVVT